MVIEVEVTELNNAQISAAPGQRIYPVCVCNQAAGRDQRIVASMYMIEKPGYFFPENQLHDPAVGLGNSAETQKDDGNGKEAGISGIDAEESRPGCTQKHAGIADCGFHESLFHREYESVENDEEKACP